MATSIGVLLENIVADREFEYYDESVCGDSTSLDAATDRP